MATHRILLVDDDPDVRGILAAALRSKYEIVEAHDGLDALHKLPNYQPDLAIIDAVMPVMDGYQLCQAVRKNRDFMGMPVLFLSAHNSQTDIKKGYASGANLYLTKPVDPMRVLKNVDFTVEHEKVEARKKRFTVEELKRVDELEARRASEEAEARSNMSTPPPRPEPVARPAAPAEPEPGPIRDYEEIDFEAGEPGGGPVEAVRNDRRARIMIVENEEDPRQLMTLALRDFYEVTCAEDGVDAVEKIVKYQPDIMLLDIMMPRMNGYQLLQTIRRNRVYGTMPIVICSAKSTRRDIEYAMKLGATKFVPKPFEPEDLITAIGGIANAPEFEVASKRYSIQEIDEMERRASDDEAERKAKREKYSDMKAILREESQHHPH